QPIYRLANLDKIWVIASVYEKDVAGIKLEQTASITLKAYPKKSFQGKVTWIADAFDEKTRTMKIRIEVENTARLLKPGMFARVALAIEQIDGVLTVSPLAIQRQGGEAIVFVDEGGGRFERREVEIGRRSLSAIEIRKGLKRGERVVTAGSFILRSELEKEGFGGGHAH
ncbi:MAG: efflux RND transporter periplasmic adaptor subunit, partial [Rhodospirillaceae bacterium]